MILDVIHPDTVRLVFVLGLVASILLYDRWHLSSGSMVTPIYIALNAHQPGALLLAGAVAVATWWIVHRALPRLVVITGRDRFLVLIPISVGMHALATLAWSGLAPAGPGEAFLLSIGYVIPGLVAHDFAAQGFRTTLAGVAGIGALLAAAAVLTEGLVAHNLPADVAGAATVRLLFDPSLLPLAVGASVTASVALVRLHQARAGGFVGAAYVAMLATEPVELALLGVATGVTWLIVVHGLMPRAIVFGRRKFAAMLLVAALVSWIIAATRDAVLGGGPGPLDGGALVLIGVTIAGLFANDVHRVGLRTVSVGTMASVTFTAAVTLSVDEVRRHGASTTAVAFLGVAGASGIVIFGPALRAAAVALVGDRARAVDRNVLPVRRAALVGIAVVGALGVVLGLGIRHDLGAFIMRAAVLAPEAWVLTTETPNRPGPIAGLGCGQAPVPDTRLAHSNPHLYHDRGPDRDRP